ncbi:MAG: DUF1638 domain-containing protein [Gammaproteobacteria bacterium]|nr:DUF1638 domain-containing protein [Gammaproteobacteria bacterium]MDH5617315.1 DUF1638 domain-containing protein [Gammaproteobacteria bacterium]
MANATVLIIACGALAKEIVTLQRLNGWSHVAVQCLPAELHNRPEKIPAAVRDMIERHKNAYASLFVAYADCGTGGRLDEVLAEYDVARLPGAHCYEFYAGTEQFAALSADEPASFYLTDFLTRHFERLVREGLGLDRHPELMATYFGNYRRLVYLSQSESAQLEEAARGHAEYLGLEFEHRHTGLAPVGLNITEHVVKWQN